MAVYEVQVLIVSQEGFHDQYHGILGGENGHMSIPPVAAFDPVFWLHHCNVDRLLAIWQAINPSVWWPSSLQRGEPSSTVDLTPFRAPNGRFWTSDTARLTKDFGYTYAESGRTPSAIAQDIGRRYNWSQQQFIPPGQQAVAPADMQDALNTSSAPFFQFNSNSIPSVLAPATTSLASGVSTFKLEQSNIDNTQKPLGSKLDTSKIPENSSRIRQWYIDSSANRCVTLPPPISPPNPPS